MDLARLSNALQNPVTNSIGCNFELKASAHVWSTTHLVLTKVLSSLVLKSSYLVTQVTRSATKFADIDDAVQYR